MKGKTTNFEKKLKSYSALATGVLAIAGTAHGQVVYTDVNPDRNLVLGDTMNIDMNHDGNIDFLVQMRDVSPNSQTNLYPIDPAASLQPVAAQALGTLQAYTNLGYADALGANAPIAPTNAHWHPGVAQWVLASVWAGTYYGHFGDGLEHYAGVFFTDNGGNKHYGWIRFSGINQAGTTCTVKDYAYETAANTQILSGNGVGITEVDNGLKANIFANDKKIHVRLNKITEGNISILNTLGQKVKSMDITNSNSVIDMDEFTSGIYIVNIQMGKTHIARKVVL